ncbi:MAG: hypothetical protein EXS13_14900 [Planctomycetes bacterium]|nr:hypothetical protein [Planctomycetota bacterium]
MGKVVDGWEEALLKMTPGSHWKLTVPPAIGYGATGSPPLIGPDATLIFELELLSFVRGRPFRQGDPSKQKRGEAGLIYEPIIEGTGPAPNADDALDLRFALWNSEGRLIECTETSARHYYGRAADMPIRLMELAPQILKLGARYRFEAPASLCDKMRWFGKPYLPAGSTTVWEIELAAIRPLTFTKPDPTKQITTASGLKYEILKQGSGAKPKITETATVVYSGYFTDGRLTDSSLLRDWTMKLQLKSGRGGVMKGWLEGLQLMQDGSIYRFEVPAELAYGAAGKPPKIPPNTPLIFEIELVKVGN